MQGDALLYLSFSLAQERRKIVILTATIVPVTCHRGGDEKTDSYLAIRGLKGGVVGARDETGAGLGDVREFTMTYDTGFGILGSQFLEKSEH